MIQWFRVPLALLEDPISQKFIQVVHNSLLIPVPRNSGLTYAPEIGIYSHRCIQS